MKMIRTTVSIPEDLHATIRAMAFEERKTLGEATVELLRQGKTKSMKNRMEKDLALFRKIAASGSQESLVKALREERDRDLS
jgi:hypothetical protein